MKQVIVFAGLLYAAGGLAHHAPGHGEPSPAAAAMNGAEPAMPASAAPTRATPAQNTWTGQPLLLPGRNLRGERDAAVLQPQGITASRVTVFAPEGPPERRKVDYPVGPEGARIASATPKIGNYHWVIAREETPELVEVASTAWYFGNPGASPKALLGQIKHELEIVPEPLPREHGSYREAEKWRFLVRFQGQPLAHQPVTLETEFGSRSTVHTEADGYATVLIPRDFKVAAEADHEGHGPRRAAFVLSTRHQTGGRSYLTAFNHFYTPDPERSRSLGWGAASGVLGMLAATPLLRRRKSQEEGQGHV